VTSTDAAQTRPSSEAASGQRKIYRHDDMPFAASALYRELLRSSGQENIFFDEGTLRPGMRFPEDIKSCLTVGSGALIAMIGSAWSSTLTSRRQRGGLERPLPAGKRGDTMGTTAIEPVGAQPRGSTSPVRTPPVPRMVRRAHTRSRRLCGAVVIAILCALLTTACSAGAHNSAVSLRTALSSSGGPSETGSPVTPSTLPTYNPNNVSQTTKPKQQGSTVISLGNIGGPTLDSRHPNGSAGHLIPWAGASTSPHCILIYNEVLPQAVTIVSVSFQVDLAGSGEAGPLQFDADNTDPSCGWLASESATASHRAATCGGVTLPPLTGDPFEGPGCVLRVDIPDPVSNDYRTGHFTFVYQTQCVDRAVAPCSLLTEQPTVAQPVTVQWSPSPFYVAACGQDPQETDADAAEGICVDESPSESPSPPTSPSSGVVSPSATPSPSP
jgi:hypothetical protein